MATSRSGLVSNIARSQGITVSHLRILELAHPPEFLALHTARVVRITLDLLFAAC